MLATGSSGGFFFGLGIKNGTRHLIREANAPLSADEESDLKRMMTMGTGPKTERRHRTGPSAEKTKSKWTIMMMRVAITEE